MTTIEKPEAYQHLVKPFADMGNLRPTFLVASTDHSGHPRIHDGGTIRLGVVEQAQRIRNHLGYENVTILKWEQKDDRYVEDQKSTDQAFPSRTDTSSANAAASNRKGVFVMEQLANTLHRVRVAREFNANGRKVMTEAFFRAYLELGGSEDELVGFIGELDTSPSSGL